MARQRAVLFIGILIFLGSIPFLTASRENKNVQTVGGDVFAVILTKDSITVIDVRSQAEYLRGHIPGVENADISDGTFKERIKSLNKGYPVAVYCASGGRSRKAAALLSDNGFSEIYELKGGLPYWDGPIEK